MRFGFQVSISHGLSGVIEQAVDRGCETIQIFTRNPRGWRGVSRFSSDEIDDFIKRLDLSGIYPLILHTPYLVNLASPEPTIYDRSIDIVYQDLGVARLLGAPYLVVHMGSHKGEGEGVGLQRMVGAIDMVMERNEGVMLLLENMAGEGYELGYELGHLASVIHSAAMGEGLGVCLDFCHAHQAGYDVRTRDGVDHLLQLFDEMIGLEYLKVLHLSDSKTTQGSRIDRHHHIGMGEIGEEGLRVIVNHPLLMDKPAILETPIEGPWDDHLNMRRIRGLVRS